MSTLRSASSASLGGLAPLSLALDGVIEKLRPIDTSDASTDGILFSGAKHEIVPRALFLDRRLTPLERNAWQIIRMMLNDDGVTAFPTYEQLRPFLASMPCAEQASDETVARALMLLRLARWLTLARHRRDSVTGRIQGNLYVLHDAPLTPWEAIQLDPHYLELIGHSLAHASKAVQRVGYFVLKEATEDPLIAGRALPTRLQEIAQRLTQRGWAQLSEDEAHDVPVPAARMPAAEQESGASDDASQPSESEDRECPTSDSEEGRNPQSLSQLRNPKADSTVRTDQLNNKQVRTVPGGNRSTVLKFPDAFHRLRAEQQAGAMAALQRVEVELQQAVLDEWAVRCRSSSVRNPAGYLFGCIQKAIRGEFRAWASERSGSTPVRGPQAPRSINTADSIAVTREQARQHIARLRAMLNIG